MIVFEDKRSDNFMSLLRVKVLEGQIILSPLGYLRYQVPYKIFYMNLISLSLQ